MRVLKNLANQRLPFYNNCAVNDLIYWKDQKQSGIVFGVGVLTLYLLKTYTLLGLLSHVMRVV